MGKKKSVGGRKSVRIKKVVQKKAAPIYNSDDDVPDEEAENFHKDDIDTYNDELLKSSDDERNGELPEAISAEKEAVYDFSDSEDEEEMEKRLRKIEVNIRRKQKKADSSGPESASESDDEMRAWGKKRDDFYGTDVRSKVDIGVSSEDEEAEARLEEKEARLLQQKLLAEMDEGDFGLDMFTGPSASVDPESSTKDLGLKPQRVVADISALSNKEKLNLLKKEYPEFITIVTDYQNQLQEYKERITPLLRLHEMKILPDSAGVDLMRLKAGIILDYCSCAQFYLLLRAEKSVVDGHPVIKRMLQFKQLLKQIDDAEAKFKHEIDFVLKKLSEGQESAIALKGGHKDDEPKSSKRLPKLKKMKPKETLMAPANEGTKKKTKKKAEKSLDTSKRRLESLLDDEDSEGDLVSEDRDPGQNGNSMENGNNIAMETAGEREALEFYDMMRKRRRADVDEDELSDEEGPMKANGVGKDDDEDAVGTSEQEKRSITEEMQKNRGLTAKRSKALKNPRIKNKLKFQRKKKIHKSMVPQVLNEMNRYSGEASGIRAGRIRSLKLS